MHDMPAFSSQFSKTMPFRQKMYRIRLVYLNYINNIVFSDHLFMININEDICQKLTWQGKISRFLHIWYHITRKLFTIVKKCIELNLCIFIRCTKLYFVLVSLWSILTKIFAKNMYFTCLFLAIFEWRYRSHFLLQIKILHMKK